MSFGVSGGSDAGGGGGGGGGGAGAEEEEDLRPAGSSVLGTISSSVLRDNSSSWPFSARDNACIVKKFNTQNFQSRRKQTTKFPHKIAQKEVKIIIRTTTTAHHCFHIY